MKTQMRAIRDAELTVARGMRQTGPSETVDRFMSRYGKIRTQKAYALHISAYLRRLEDEGVEMGPDKLAQDNLNCVYGATGRRQGKEEAH